MSIVAGMANGSITGGSGKNALKLLVDEGADLGKRDSTGNTVLHMAVQLGVDMAVSAFIKKGANVRRLNAAGKTPFEYQRRKQRPIGAVCQKAEKREDYIDSRSKLEPTFLLPKATTQKP